MVPDKQYVQDDELDAAVEAYAAAADAESTVRTYTWAWNRFQSWCEEHGETALPASTRTLNRFTVAVADDPDRPVSLSSLEVLRSAIAWKHTTAGFPDPTKADRARRTRRGIRKTRKRAGETTKQAPPLLAADIETIVDSIHDSARTWRQHLAARRDIALIVVGYDFGRRGGELSRLTLGDLSLTDDTADGQLLLRMRLRGGKTHQDSIEYFYRPRGSRDGRTCPWCALTRWITVLHAADAARASVRSEDPETVDDAVSTAVQRLLPPRKTADPREHCCEGDRLARGRARARLFRPLSNGGIPHAPDAGLSDRSIRAIVDARSIAAGLGPHSTHGLRAGVATELFNQGADVYKVMSVTGHLRPASALHYDRRRAQRGADADTGL